MAQSLQTVEKPLRELAAVLPLPEEAALGEDADRQARAVLAILVERALLLEARGVPLVFDPSCCPNCGAAAPSERSPYCGTECREESGFVRQLRNSLTNGTVFDEERQASMGQKLWHVLGGGYPRRQKLVPEKARARLLARNEGKCEICGKPATTFDHTGSG